MGPAKGQDDQTRFDLVDRLVSLEAIYYEDAGLDRPQMLFRDIMGPAHRQEEDNDLFRVKDPQIPAVANLTLAGDEDQPAGLVGMP